MWDKMDWTSCKSIPMHNQKIWNLFNISQKLQKKKGEKSKNIGRDFLQCQQMSRLSIPIFDLFKQLKELWLGWQKKTNTAIDQESRLKKALKDLAMLKTICDNGKVLKLPYVHTRLQNTSDDGSLILT